MGKEFIDTLVKNSSRSKSAFVGDMISIPFRLTDETRKEIKAFLERCIIGDVIRLDKEYGDNRDSDDARTIEIEIEGLESLYTLVNKGVPYDEFYHYVIDDRTLSYCKGLCYLVNKNDASSCLHAYVISFRKDNFPVFVFFDTEDFRKLTDDDSRMEYIMSVFEKNMVFNNLTIPNIIELADYVKENKPVFQDCVHRLPAPGESTVTPSFPFYLYAFYA